MRSLFARLEPRHPLARRVLLMIGVVLVLGFAESGWRAAKAMGQPTEGARWIWAADHHIREQAPQAFYLVRDFALEAPLQEAATMLVAGDEEYVVWLNGQRVGSGRFGGMPLDAYQVAPLLRAGGNRLVAGVRSRRSAGGFLLSILAGSSARQSARPIVVTDRTWRVQRAARAGLIEGWLPVAPPGSQMPEGFRGITGEEPVDWGVPPTGRWGVPQVPAAGPASTLWRDRLSAAVTLPGSRAGEGRAGSVRFDFGHEVVGYLTIRFAPRPVEEGPAAALVALSIEAPPDLAGGAPEATIAVVPPGARLWRDASVRRFRYLEVFGQVEAEATIADPVEPEFAAAAVGDDGPPPVGLAGVVPPPTRAPIEDTLRRELERLAAERNGAPGRPN